MKQFKSWQAPIFSFFSTQFYRDLGANGKGIGCRYLFALLVVACAVTPIRIWMLTHEGAGASLNALIDQMPDITVKQGTLSINKESPWAVTDDQSNYLVEFDASSDRTKVDNAPIMISKHNIFIKYSEDKLDYNLPLKEIGDLTLTKAQIGDYMRLAAAIGPVLGYFFSLWGAWIGHFLWAFALSIGGLIVAKMINVKISFAGLMRVSACAVGVAIILQTISLCVDVQFPWMEEGHWILIKGLAAIVYTLFGVGANLSQPHFEPVFLPDNTPNDPK